MDTPTEKLRKVRQFLESGYEINELVMAIRQIEAARMLAGMGHYIGERYNIGVRCFIIESVQISNNEDYLEIRGRCIKKNGKIGKQKLFRWLKIAQ